MKSRQMETVIAGGHVLLPDGTLEETDVTLSGGRIAAIGEAPKAGIHPITAQARQARHLHGSNLPPSHRLPS